jgi:large subunit ribosomal protein L30
MAKLKITLHRSKIGSNDKQIATVQALGLGKTNSSVVQDDNAVIKGMIRKVAHLVRVEEVQD